MKDTNPDAGLQHIFHHEDPEVISHIRNPGNGILNTLSSLLNITAGEFGDGIVVDGPDSAVAAAALKHIAETIQKTGGCSNSEIMKHLQQYQPAPEEKPAASVSGGMEIKTPNKTIVPKSQGQKTYASSLFENEMCFGIGPAGSGKTYLAVAAGVQLFKSGVVDKIILSRPAVEAGEKLGYLPGDAKEKVDPYMQPLYDALTEFLGGKVLTKMIENKDVEISPLAFMRGRTLKNAFVLLDEAQNATPMQMKMFLTRLGEGSRMAIVGDKTQNDLPKNVESGLVDAERTLKGVPGIGFSELDASDVVRHPLVARIIKAYDQAQ